MTDRWARLVNIAELVGALGVIASLIYLAKQVRDSAKSSYAGAYEARISNYRQLVLTIVSDANTASLFRRGLIDITPLSPDENIRFGYLLGEFVLHYQDMRVSFEQGLISKERMTAWENYTAAILNMPGASAQWQMIRDLYVADTRVRLENARASGLSLASLAPRVFPELSKQSPSTEPRQD